MAVQMCLATIIPAESKSVEQRGIGLTEVWSLKQRDFFRRKIQTDTPMKCQLIEIHNVTQSLEFDVSFKPPQHWPEVYYVKNLCSAAWAGESIEDSMLLKELATEGTCIEEHSTNCHNLD
jgi:hypothetical protein